MLPMNRLRPTFGQVAVAASVFVATPLATGAKAQPAPARPGFLAGYLSQKDLPDSLALLPPPPAAGSTALSLDEEFNLRAVALHGTARWRLATEDANLMFPQAANIFSCALNAPITEKDTPHLYTLMRRTLADAGLATYTAKKHYSRKRPFAVDNKPSCTPDAEAHLMSDGSYPSGHSAIGFSWALILSEIAPDRTDALLVRGQVFGQSRVICNVHWESDVIEGRIVGAATVAKLHANPEFLADLQAAKSEFAAVHARGLKPTGDCGAEAAAIALDPPLSP
jgi:acid phosphatase (class A)